LIDRCSDRTRKADKQRRPLAADLVTAQRWAPSDPAAACSERPQRAPRRRRAILVGPVPPGGPSCGALPRVAKLKNP